MSLLPLEVAEGAPWAELLEEVFALDVLACPDRGGKLQMIAFIAEATVAGWILAHLGIDSSSTYRSRNQNLWFMG